MTLSPSANVPAIVSVIISHSHHVSARLQPSLSKTLHTPSPKIGRFGGQKRYPFLLLAHLHLQEPARNPINRFAVLLGLLNIATRASGLAVLDECRDGLEGLEAGGAAIRGGVVDMVGSRAEVVGQRRGRVEMGPVCVSGSAAGKSSGRKGDGNLLAVRKGADVSLNHAVVEQLRAVVGGFWVPELAVEHAFAGGESELLVSRLETCLHGSGCLAWQGVGE
jgi:hypothetical protein